MVDLSFVIGVLVLLLTIMYRQRSAYRTYQRTQQQVLDRQAEMMTLYRGRWTIRKRRSVCSRSLPQATGDNDLRGESQRGGR